MFIARNNNNNQLILVSIEHAEFVKKFAFENCPDEKIWMGYETIDKNHFWLDDNLEMVKPVPEEHIEGTKSIGCNYFQFYKELKLRKLN